MGDRIAIGTTLANYFRKTLVGDCLPTLSSKKLIDNIDKPKNWKEIPFCGI